MEDNTLYLSYSCKLASFLTPWQQQPVCNVVSIIFTLSDHLLLLQTKFQQHGNKERFSTKLFFFFKEPWAVEKSSFTPNC